MKKHDELYTTEELADLIKYHPESIRRACRQGRIKTIRVGRDYRVTADEVERILREGLPPVEAARPTPVVRTRTRNRTLKTA